MINGKKRWLILSGQGKGPVLLKALCGLKKNGGLQLPKLRIYFEAVGLCWIQDWITLENNRLLSLEGYNLAYGWHAYLLYEKWKSDKFFKDHVIRKALLQIWQKYKSVYEERKPM